MGALVGGIALIVATALPVGPAVLVMLVIAGFGIGAAQGVFWTVPAALQIGGGLVPIGVIAAISMAGTAGGIVGPSMMGWLVERFGSHAPAIIILAGFLLLAALLLGVYASRQTGRTP
jgi:ACS family tartrate transporter-like MFS transporter